MLERMGYPILFSVDCYIAFVQMEKLLERAKERLHKLEDHASKCHRRNVAERATARQMSV